MKNHRRRGLTLIEIVVSITIISLMMTAVAVYAMGVRTGALDDVAQQDVRVALTALEMFKARRNRYPTAAEGFASLVELRVLKKVPKDPWGGELAYTVEDGEPVVTSLGSDHQPGGAGDAADLSSSQLTE